MRRPTLATRYAPLTQFLLRSTVANSYLQLSLADEIVAALGDDPAVISGAAALVAAEQNFNPFVVSIPSICSDATLPATEALRGIVPLVDPAVTGSDVQNANSETSLTTPFDATGLSVAEVMTAQGFDNFTPVDAAGNEDTAADTAADVSSGTVASASAASTNGTASSSSNRPPTASSSPVAVAGNTGASSSDSSSASDSTTTDGTTSLADADFGLCTPTMDFQLGRADRKATEGTFLPTDPLVAEGQQDALNPNIIANKICDQLTNVCEANQAAKDACASAEALVAGLGTKDQTTADAFNQALGF